MPTFKQIQDRVGSYLIDLPTETAALIPDWINAALTEAMERHNFRVMEATESFTTTAETRLLGSKPDDWKEARGDPWRIDGPGGGSGAQTKEIDWLANQAEAVRLFNDDATLDIGPPRELLETETTIEVYPYPDDRSLWSDGNYRLRVPYWKTLPELAADADTNWFTTHAHWYLTFHAVAEGMVFNREEERAAVYATKAEREFKRATNVDKRSRLTSGTFAVYRDVNATRRQPRSF